MTNSKLRNSDSVLASKSLRYIHVYYNVLIRILLPHRHMYLYLEQQYLSNWLSCSISKLAYQQVFLYKTRLANKRTPLQRHLSIHILCESIAKILCRILFLNYYRGIGHQDIQFPSPHLKRLYCIPHLLIWLNYK